MKKNFVPVIVTALGAGLLRCGGESCASPSMQGPAPLVPALDVRVVQQGVESYVTDLITAQSGEILTIRAIAGVAVTAERGQIAIDATPAHNVTYTAPASGSDRISLRTTGGATMSDRGWVAVRVMPPPPALPSACAADSRGTVTGGAPVAFRRNLGAPRLDSLACAVPVAYRDVNFYAIRVGEQLRLSQPLAMITDSPEITASGTTPPVRVEPAAGAAITVTGVREGWAAVHVVFAGACRSTLMIDVLPAVPVMDAGGDVPDAADVPDAMDVPDAPDASDVPDATDAMDAQDGPDVPDAGDVPDVPMTATASYDVGDAIPLGLVELDGGLYWYNAADFALHRFDIATGVDRVALAATSLILRDMVAAGGRVYWTSGPGTSATEVIGWHPGDAAPAAAVLTSRGFDQLFGDGTRLYAHDASGLQWALNDGTMAQTAGSTSSQRAFAVAGDRIYLADLGLFTTARGVYRATRATGLTTLLTGLDTVIPTAGVMADDTLPGSLLVDGTTLYALGHRVLLRAHADGTGTPTELARFPSSAPSTATWTRMCLARGRLYMVEQFEGGLWTVPADGSGMLTRLASPGSVGFEIACTADSVWWWSRPRLYRYRLP